MSDNSETNTSPISGGEKRTKRSGFEAHPIKVVPFAFGMAFVVIGIAGLSSFSLSDAAAWMWVIALTVFGLAGLSAALSRR